MNKKTWNEKGKVKIDIMPIKQKYDYKVKPTFTYPLYKLVAERKFL